MIKSVPLVLATLGLALVAAEADAGVIYLASGQSGGQNVSGQADITYGNGSITIELSNLTATTYDAAQLLTAFRFSLGAVGGATALSSAVTPSGRTVGTGGDYTDSATSKDLLGLNTWSLNSVGGGLQLQFNPDAKYAILGAPDAGTGVYGSANGSIIDNKGHNPFANGSATFVLSNSNFTTATRLSDVTFLWGTNLGASTSPPPPTAVPLPPAAWTGLGLLGALGTMRWARRRRQPA